MKKLLGISLIAILSAGSAFAVESVTPNTNVATTSYVQGAFNQLQEQVNGKQEKLMVGEAVVNSEVLTDIRPIETATDTDLVTEKAVRAAINTALGSVEGGIQSVETGTEGMANGTISVDGTPVAVKGLGSAAYKDETDFATQDSIGTALASGTYTDINIGTNPVVTTATAENATFTPRDESGFGTANNIKDALNNLDTRVSEMEGFMLALYGEYGNPNPTAYVNADGQIVLPTEPEEP